MGRPVANRKRRLHTGTSPPARRCDSARRRRAAAAGISECACSDRVLQWSSSERFYNPMMKLIAAFLLAVVASSVQAQAFPNRPVTLIVPFSPGTGIDILARVIAPKLSEKWGQPVVV